MIVVIESSGVLHPMISMLFILYRLSEYPLSWNLPCDSVQRHIVITLFYYPERLNLAIICKDISIISHKTLCIKKSLIFWKIGKIG